MSDAITVDDVDDLMRMMETGARPGQRAKGDRRYGRPVGAKSIRNYIGTLSALLGFAERKGLGRAANPSRTASSCPPPRAARTSASSSRDEVRRARRRAIDGPYQAIDRALYVTAAMTGLRHGELIALRWRDVDWRAGRIRVRQNYVLGEFGTPKSRRSTRSVPMADERRRRARPALPRRRDARGDDDLVFADPHTGEPLDKAAILRRYRSAR